MFACMWHIHWLKLRHRSPCEKKLCEEVFMWRKHNSNEGDDVMCRWWRSKIGNETKFHPMLFVFIFHPLLQVQSPILLKLTDLAPSLTQCTLQITLLFNKNWLKSISKYVCFIPCFYNGLQKLIPPNLQNLF